MASFTRIIKRTVDEDPRVEASKASSPYEPTKLFSIISVPKEPQDRSSPTSKEGEEHLVNPLTQDGNEERNT